MPEPIRLQKFLSQSGRASRREAERLMLAGRVRVNGEVVSELGTRVVPGQDAVEVDGEVVAIAETRWVAFNKPPGVLTTRRDPHGGTTIYDVLPSELGALRYVGRLDRDAEGLLILTNDGDRANALQHPRGEVEREYSVDVAGTPDGATLARLRGGVELEDGPARAKVARLEPAAGSADGSADGSTDGTESTVTVVLTEGRKREVRRMLSAVGHPVLRLRRTRFGPVRLGALKRGGWRDLDGRERAALDGMTAPD